MTFLVFFISHSAVIIYRLKRENVPNTVTATTRWFYVPVEAGR